MAKTCDELLAVIDSASGQVACAAEALENAHAILAAVAELSERGSVTRNLAVLGAGLAERAADDARVTLDDLNAEVRHA